MVPEDKWKVAVAQAPKIPRRSPPTSENDGATPDTLDAPVSANSPRVEEPATGESGEILDTLLAEFKPLSKIKGEERGWVETLGHQAVEELNQWLQKSGDHLDAPPPPYAASHEGRVIFKVETKGDPATHLRPERE